MDFDLSQQGDEKRKIKRFTPFTAREVEYINIKAGH